MMTYFNVFRVFSYSIFTSIFNILCVHSLGQDQCSFNLVSGLYGVPDDHLSATSTYMNGASFLPPNGRLHSTTCWLSSGKINQHIQVDFDNYNKILAVQTQGRHDWVERVGSYAVSYSLDSNKWTFITDENNNEKIFPGNYDKDTVVTNELPEAVVAKYFRIHPRTGYGSYFGLRFDLIGCRASSNSWMVHPISITAYQDSLWNKSASDLGKCATLCYHQSTCQSFVYNSDMGTCTGFEQEYLHGYRLDVLRGDLYFLRSSTWENHVIILQEGGYTSVDDVIYKIYTDPVNVTYATSVCRNDSTGLLSVRNINVLKLLQNDIKTSTNTAEFKFFVGGSQEDGKWVYNNHVEIPVDLWADGQPNNNDGDCVIITEVGLQTESCSIERRFVCGF